MKQFQIKKCKEHGGFCVYARKSTGDYGLFARFEQKEQALELVEGTEFDDLTKASKKTSKESKKTAGNTNLKSKEDES